MEMKFKGIPLVEWKGFLILSNRTPLVGLWGGQTWAKGNVFTTIGAPAWGFLSAT